MALTLEQLQVAIRRRLGWPSDDTFISDDEIFEMIRTSQVELQDLLISIHGGDWRLVVASFDTVANNFIYPIGVDVTSAFVADISRVRRVAAWINETTSRPMRRWNIETDFHDFTPVAWDENTDIVYRFSLEQPAHLDTGFMALYVFPVPSNVVPIEIWYNAGPGTMSLTSAINQLGNDEYIILDGMIKCLEAEETDTSSVERKKEALIQRMTANQAPADGGSAAVIQDARSAWPLSMDRGRVRW